MSQNQLRAPLYEALCAYVDRVKAPFHVPGHKMGRAAPISLLDRFGERVLALDQTEAPGLDDLHSPDGAIADAERLAAEAFGAAHSFFLVGGSTAGIHALLLACAVPGSRVAVPRNAHRSVLGGLILAGATPVWVKARFHPEVDIAVCLDNRSLETALPGAIAAVLIHPTYFGTVGPLQEQILTVHHRGAIALVDEAHGTHFGFHPALPPPALSLGADGTVHSMHKTGGSLTQSSMCHLGSGSRLTEQQVRPMLRLVQSTSPSYLLMASLDLARRDLALHGRSRWERTLELGDHAQRRLKRLRGIRVHAVSDPTRLVIDPRGRGLTGVQAAAHLWSNGISVETAGRGYLLAILTPGDTPESIEQLIRAVDGLPHEGADAGSPPIFPPEEAPWPEVVLSPREAYLGPKEAATLAGSVGRIAAELVAPYPPGIPVVAPGERLTGEVVSYLLHAAKSGCRLQGPADPHLHTIYVVRE